MPEKHSRPTPAGRAHWWTERLWRLSADLPVRTIAIDEIAEFDMDCWFDGRPATCRAVTGHAKRIVDADLSHPVILSADGGLMDGGHRIARAWLDGATHVDAVRFEQDPEPDWIEDLQEGYPTQRFPVLEFDPDASALINPRPRRSSRPVPERAVMCFFQDVIADVCGDGRATEILKFTWEHGTHPLYELEVDGDRIAVFHPGVGAPMAAGHMEEAIASGCNTFVACGGAGAVIPGLALGHVVVPTAAVRDEGTSYHYLPPSREIACDPEHVAAAVAVLERRDIPYTKGKTWTTDAPYRETRSRIERRRAEGCLTVEMETAAFIAVARFRGVRFAQYLYAGDDVSGDQWDHRSWQTASVRHDLFWLAVEAARTL
jgi:uridine phosphorylase